MTALLEIEHLATHFHTDDGVVKAVDDVSLRVEEGKTLGIVGESGSGKSVTSFSVMRLLSGNGQDRSRARFRSWARIWSRLPEPEMRKIRGKEISMIFQEPMTSLNPVFTVGWQVMEAIMLHQNVSQGRGPPDRRSSCSTKSAFPIRNSGSIRIRTRCPAARSSG